MPFFSTMMNAARPIRYQLIEVTDESPIDLYALAGSPEGPVSAHFVFAQTSVTSTVTGVGFHPKSRLFLKFLGHSLGPGGNGGDGGRAIYDPEGFHQVGEGTDGAPGSPALILGNEAWIEIPAETGGNLWAGGGGGGGQPGTVSGSNATGGDGGGGGVSKGLGGSGGSAQGGTPNPGDNGSDATDGIGASPGTAIGADGGDWAQPGTSAADSGIGTKGGKGGAPGPAIKLVGIERNMLHFSDASLSTLKSLGQIKGDVEVVDG